MAETTCIIFVAMIEKGALLHCIPDTDSTSVIKSVVAVCRFLTFVALLGTDKARHGIHYSTLAYCSACLTKKLGQESVLIPLAHNVR